MNTVKSLKIYTKSLALVVEIYKLVEVNSKLAKDFSLCDQIKRASVSIPANISEGYARTRKNFKNYLDIAKDSSNEVITLLEVIRLVFNINTLKLQEEYNYLARQITSFSNSF